MSALPPIADIPRRNLNVRFGALTDIGACPRYVRFTCSKSRHQPPNLTIYGCLASETTRNGQREPKIVRQHAECHRDDENCYWQR